MKTLKISFVVFGALALVACERREDRTPTIDRRDEPVVIKREQPSAEKDHDLLDKLGDKGAKGGGPLATGEREKARDRLAAVRCDHYKQCGDIAKDKKYETYDSCITREKADIDKDWKFDDCARIDTPRLDACVAAVSSKKCDVLFSSTPSECGESKICIK